MLNGQHVQEQKTAVPVKITLLFIYVYAFDFLFMKHLWILLLKGMLNR